MGALWAAALSLAIVGVTAQPAPDPHKLIQEADRLAWLRAWNAAEPLYRQAQKLHGARGDARNALYAEISAFRGQLPRTPVPLASARLAEYLERPLVKSDDLLRLRALVIKGEIDEDLDPSLAGNSWREVQTLAEKLKNDAWANRARGELGLVAFLQGDIGGSVVALGQALKVAQSNGDVSSLVRWLTLFGHGYVQLGRPQEALDFYDRALKAAAAVPELQFPVMTYVGRSNALIRLGRADEADRILTEATAVAAKFDARGYQAQLLSQRALIASQRKQPEQALTLMMQATELAAKAGANRIVAEIAIDAARIQRERGQLAASERTLRAGIDVARAMEERLLLPRLLAELANLRSSQRRDADAARLLDEAGDLLEGLLTSASSPWTQSRVISGMDDVLIARIRLEGSRPQNASRMFVAIERARGRPLLELLVNRPLSGQRQPTELQEGERRISSLQRRLLQTSVRRDRERLLEQIFAAEEQLAPVTTAFFNGARRAGPRAASSLAALQSLLQPDELFLQFALSDPQSFVVVATRSASRVQSLAARNAISGQVERLLKRVKANENPEAESQAVSQALLAALPELKSYRRLVISPDAELHHLPFELLTGGDGQPLLHSHILSYTPSGSVLEVLRRSAKPTLLRTLAVSASPVGDPAIVQSAKSITRNIYDLDPANLRPLPSADDEARSVGSILGTATSTVLLGRSATEDEVKRQPLHEFGVVHFAVHGIPSSKFPARAALLLQPGTADDGVLQAREILALRLNAALVTLSACDTGSGSIHGQDGAASLVRPFIASGARTVVANLWAADDAFSLTLMREFYRRLAAGADVAEALRDAKRHMLRTFGPQATPRLWSGLLAYGDGRSIVRRAEATASSGK